MPLDPEIAALLESQKQQPPRSSLDIAGTREMMRRAAALAGPPPALARIEDLVLPDGPRARQYWPVADAALPLAVYFHGGRFFSGDLETHDTVCRLLALASGCRVLAVDYRLAPEHRFPAAVHDANTAVEWALGQGVPVAVAGDSAGANLAAGAALARRGPELRCQLLIYPMIDATCASLSYAGFAEGYGPGAADMKRGWAEYLPQGTDPRNALASPLFAEDLRGAPPAFVLTAEYDTLRGEGEAYAQRLVESGNIVQARRYLGTIHGFFTMQGTLRAAREAMQDAAAFLKGALSPLV
jgi:acetyl esterase/lipase